MKKLPLTAILAIFLILPLPASGSEIIPGIEEVSGRVLDFVSGDEVIIVMGTRASVAERGILALLQKTYGELSSIPVVREYDYKTQNKTLILVGGPSQNRISESLIKNSDVSEEIGIASGKVIFIDSGTKAVIFSDHQGFSPVSKQLDNSPLSGLVEPELIPAAATGIGISLILLWNFLTGLLVKIAKYKFVSRVMRRFRKREIREKFRGAHLRGIRLKVREWISILIAAMVFAVSLSYMYLSPRETVTRFLLMTIAVNFMVYSIRNGTRLVLDRHYNHHTEYHIWYWGAILTAITGWLGNTFAMAGYVVSEKDTEYEGKMALLINIITFLFFLGFWVWNFIFPSLLAHMAMLLSLAITFLQMLPISPFSGKNIFRWHRRIWAAGFIPLALIYLAVSLF